jgi:hypothetical protein
MKQVLTFIALLCTCVAALATAGESNEAVQPGCEVTRLYFWDFEVEPTDWAGTGWGWCDEATMVGPDSCRSGVFCRGTVCTGNYTPFTTYWMETPPIQLPELLPGQEITLMYYQWYRIYTLGLDAQFATVQISVNFGPWETLLEKFHGYSDWSPGGASLANYAGQSVRVRFYLKIGVNSCNPSYFCQEGWYVDDVGIYLHTLGVDAGDSVTICKGDCVQLGAVVGCYVWPYTCSWFPVEGLSHPNCLSTNACPDTTTTYVIIVTDDSSNAAADTVVVTVEPCTDVPLDNGILPPQFSLQQNYPDPFNPLTTISYTLPQRSYVTITVFNILDQKVRTLVDEIKPPGTHEIVWDGTDQSGKPVSSGMYFYKLQAGDYVETRKMVLLK